MPHLDDEVLARALEVLVQGSRQGDTIVDPFSPLQKQGIPKEAVVQLIQRGCLVGQGRLRFRIVRTTLAPPRPAQVAPPPLAEIPDVPDGWFEETINRVPPSHAATLDPPPPPLVAPTTEQRLAPATRAPCFLLVVDVENVARTCRDLHAPFRPEAVREVATQCGEIAFAFAVGNLLAVGQRDRELLTIAGFPLLHCARLPDGNGGKDTVDENIANLIHRFVDRGVVDGVILATDDRNFIPIMTHVRDRGLQLIRIAVRTGTELDRIGEVRYLPLHEGEPANGVPATPSKPWAPKIVVDGLQDLIRVSSQTERERAIRAMNLDAPLVCKVLRLFLRRWWSRNGPRWLTSFTIALDELRATVLVEDRVHITGDDLHAFLDALIQVGVIEKITSEKQGRPQHGYRPIWSHPFCQYVVSGVQERGPRYRSSRDEQRGAPGTNGSGTNGADHEGDAPDAPSGPPSEGRR
ncbi:MAG: NYN domain-containing protein [bacterium]|nr:NYN domain-containing protein [bacterium]